MQSKWSINKTPYFSEVEKIDAKIKKIDANTIHVKQDNSEYICKKYSTWKFLFKRYPLMFVATSLLTIMFLAIYPIIFFIYFGLVVLFFTLLVRFCKVRYMGTYIMWLWLIHLAINFFVLGNGSLFSFAIATSEKFYYIQSLFFGMLLIHLWQYIFIMLHQYYHLYSITEVHEDGDINISDWYIWKHCSLCNNSFNPFKCNCKEVI